MRGARPKSGCAALARRSAGTLVALLLGVALAAPPAPAAEDSAKERARGPFEKAQIQYKVGHFQEALEGYSRAYELFPAPAFLFNIGQCHKNLKNYERAVFFFEGYLREEKNPDKRALAEELLAESKAAMDKQAARAPLGAAAGPSLFPSSSGALGAGSAAPTSASPPTSGPALVAAAPGSPGATDPRSSLRSFPRWLWAVAGGVVAAAVGGYLYWSSGATTWVPPPSSAGTIDGRGP
jgi:hypothetical protein